MLFPPKNYYNFFIFFLNFEIFQVIFFQEIHLNYEKFQLSFKKFKKQRIPHDVFQFIYATCTRTEVSLELVRRFPIPHDVSIYSERNMYIYIYIYYVYIYICVYIYYNMDVNIYTICIYRLYIACKCCLLRCLNVVCIYILPCITLYMYYG